MNILYFAHESRLGGANLSLLGLLEEMKKEQQVFVVVPIRKGFFVEELKRRNIQYIYMHSFWWMLEPTKNVVATKIKKCVYRILVLYNYISACRLKGIIKKYNIDVIHTNSSVINTGAILSKITGVPHVWHIREFGEEDFNFFSVVPRNKINRYIDSYSNKIIAISEAVACKYRNNSNEDKLCVVYNGVSDENVYKKAITEYSDDKLQFLISGRISKEKGHEQVLEAAALLINRGIVDFHINIAGPGDTCELMDIAKRLEIEPYVTYLGMREDLSRVRKSMDVELVCSRCEAFGRVTVEAMMSSNPVIGSNCGGTPELVEDGQNGLLYKYGDTTELAMCMEKLICDRKMLIRLGTNAFLSTHMYYTAKRNADEIAKIYQEIIQ